MTKNLDRWQVYDSGDGCLDVTPIYDSRQHEADDGCWCGVRWDGRTRIHTLVDECLPDDFPKNIVPRALCSGTRH